MNAYTLVQEHVDSLKHQGFGRLIEITVHQVPSFDGIQIRVDITDGVIEAGCLFGVFEIERAGDPAGLIDHRIRATLQRMMDSAIQ